MLWASCLAPDRLMRLTRSSMESSVGGGLEAGVVSLGLGCVLCVRVSRSSGSVMMSVFWWMPRDIDDVRGLAVEAVCADGDGEVPGAALGPVGGEGVAVGDAAALAEVGVAEHDFVPGGVESDGDAAVRRWR